MDDRLRLKARQIWQRTSNGMLLMREDRVGWVLGSRLGKIGKLVAGKMTMQYINCQNCLLNDIQSFLFLSKSLIHDKSCETFSINV